MSGLDKWRWWLAGSVAVVGSAAGGCAVSPQQADVAPTARLEYARPATLPEVPFEPVLSAAPVPASRAASEPVRPVTLVEWTRFESGSAGGSLSAAEPQPVPVLDHPQSEPPVPAAPLRSVIESDESGAGEVAFEGTDVSVPDAAQLPIDLATVLRLAGADNWAVQLAREETQRAHVRTEQAEAMWLPNLSFGVGYTRHRGQLQATNGQVRDINRSSFFLGGGPRISDAPLTGGAGGPARLVVDLSLADALFEPLARRQQLSAARSQQHAVFNDTLSEAAVGYFELLAAQGRYAIATRDVAESETVRELTRSFVEAGKSSPAEITRIDVEAARREQRTLQAELSVRVASTRLARILQLNPRKMPADSLLHSVESLPVPVELVAPSASLHEMIAQAESVRPEIQAARAQVEVACTRQSQEEWRPWLPNVNLGFSSGAFGGGPGFDISGLAGRSDFDAGLVWEVRNMGVGTRAIQEERESDYRRLLLEQHRVTDGVAAEVAEAYYEVEARRKAIQLARDNIQSATEVYETSLDRIRGLVGLPLEALQAVQALSESRYAYLDAVTAYNQAQCRLLRAIGQPVDGAAGQ